jgi:hypothetical protein
MFSRARSFWFLGLLAVGARSFAACSEEPRSVAGHCEDIPLYRQVYDEETDTWTRVAIDGGSLSAEDNERIDTELNRKGPRCLTPTGPETHSSGGAASSDASSGGSDAATDATSSD